MCSLGFFCRQRTSLVNGCSAAAKGGDEQGPVHEGALALPPGLHVLGDAS